LKVRELVEAFGRHKIIREFLEENKNSRQHIARFEGMAGSSASVVLASIFHQTGKNILILVPEMEEAEFLRSDLEHLVSENEVMLLKDSFKQAFISDESNPDQIQSRAELVSKLQHALHPYIVIATPEGISEKIISTEQLKKNTFEIRLGEKLDFEFVSDFLDENEFEREDFVYEPGQYAIRGGILDIYSFSNPKPYRIELDGDTIESIRTFDIDSQLSIAKIGFLSIVPNIQSQVISGEKVSLFKYFDEDSFVVLKHFEDQFQYLVKQWESLLEDGQKPEQTWLNPKDVKALVSGFN
jgi:transcription-repair coupling factor (superfamily II helicase)